MGLGSEFGISGSGFRVLFIFFQGLGFFSGFTVLGFWCFEVLGFRDLGFGVSGGYLYQGS